jgi:predicted nuclease with TOPRIM domain
MAYAEDLCEQLADRYEARQKSFSQLFSATLIFALVFLAFILVPFVGLQLDEKIILKEFKSADLERSGLAKQHTELSLRKEGNRAKLVELSVFQAMLEGQLAPLADKIEAARAETAPVEKALQESKKAIAKLEVQNKQLDRLKQTMSGFTGPDVDRFVVEVRAFLQPAAGVVYDGEAVDSLGVGAECQQANKQHYFDCLVKSKVMLELTVPYLQGPLAIVPRIREVDKNLARELEAKIDQAVLKFDAILSDDPDWWQEVTHKRHVGQMFEGVVYDLMRGIDEDIKNKSLALAGLEQSRVDKHAELTAIEKELSRKLSDLNRSSEDVVTKKTVIVSEVNKANAEFQKTEKELSRAGEKIEQLNLEFGNLTERFNQINVAKAAVTKRIENVESPFGSFPVGLNEALQAFPIIVAAGFLMCILALSELTRLRLNYHQTLRSRYADNNAEVDSNMVMLAPLFIDPCRNTLTNLWRSIVLGIPLLVYILAIYLITFSWSLDESVGENSARIRNIYLFVYIFFVVLLAFPLTRLVVEWRRYQSGVA